MYHSCGFQLYCMAEKQQQTSEQDNSGNNGRQATHDVSAMLHRIEELGCNRTR